MKIKKIILKKVISNYHNNITIKSLKRIIRKREGRFDDLLMKIKYYEKYWKILMTLTWKLNNIT